jgi:hypothetical protein
MIGLGPLLRTNPGTVIQKMIANDPAAGWAAYESSLHSELLMAMGARVVSGLKTVPDLGFYEPIDASHRDEDIYNRYSFAKFSIRDEQESVELRSAGFPIHAVSIHPLNRALRARNVRYFLFVRPLPDSARWGIQLLRALPENRIWIYGVIPDTLSNVPEKGVVTLG